MFHAFNFAAVSLNLVEQIDRLLPQTQCTKCGYPSCHLYAQAIANGEAKHNQCPPGGKEGISRLSQLLNYPVLALDNSHGLERERSVAVIEEAYCIGCTLCIQACPVDAIIGAPKQMHTVLVDLCTGCDLCVSPCPVDCISMEVVTPGETGWQAWSQAQADQSRHQYDFRQQRLQREKQENDARLLLKATAKLKALEDEPAQSAEELQSKERKKAIIAAAIERARIKKLMAEKPETKS
ncbi:electron transport complex subunit RsxB [Undibacterium sp. SXout7W]|uniref:electron transport complex subunit RsxB n=1 Tax=Undibacterium sp. SXout7W TaxID=3413049 RepID=UPI003BF4EB25